MTGSMKYEGGELVVRQGSRITMTTAGQMVQFLTTEQTYTASLAFPDVTKGELYGVQYDVDYSAGVGYGYDVQNVSAVGALPQEWSNTLTLGAVPSGADIFIGRATLTRTVSPTHNWLYGPINPRIPTGVAIQITGTFTLEEELGFGRQMSVYIADGSSTRPGTPGNLSVHMNQSVGPACGGAGDWGKALTPNESAIGGRNEFPSGGGILVYQNASSPYTKRINGSTSSFFAGPNNLIDRVSSMYNGQSNQAVYSDPTNYASTYSLTVQGRYGRCS